MTGPSKPGHNRLAAETSPYLLQHADNPVHWYAWGDEAFAAARSTDRPILLSIGYSACHWCHVMAHESFEDPDTAALMNRDFINVKVDREERPDVDHIYMTAVQALSGHGGWPLTVFLTPDGRPFFGGTYFPPAPRHNLPSFSEVLSAASRAYRDRRGDVDRTAAELTELIDRAGRGRGPANPDRSRVDPETVLQSARNRLARSYDSVHGGFGRAPKFPQPLVIELLLRAATDGRDPTALSMATGTLGAMARGGIHDHLGGGFHRYSVDARWLVPHFEKMLYDNALLVPAYLAAWRATREPEFRSVVESTLEYVRTDLRAPGGGFRAARDADSEGREGAYYVWRPDELRSVLGDEAELFGRVYDVSEAGNFEGANILHLPHDLDAIARSVGTARTELEARLARARAALLDARSRREPPQRDDKILAGWSALAVRAFAEAGATLGRPDWVDLAAEGERFLLGPMSPGGRLRHSFLGIPSDTPAFLDDVAAVGNAAISLYEATLDPAWLAPAVRCVDEILERFWEPDQRLLFDAPSDGEPLIVRPRDLHDGATPSGNTQAAELFVRLQRLLERDDLTPTIERLLDPVFGDPQHPLAFAGLLGVLDAYASPPLEVTVVGPASDPVRAALLGVVHRAPARFCVIAGGDPEALGDGPEVPFLEERPARGGRSTAYVCWNRACSAPIGEPDALAEALAAVVQGPSSVA